MTKFLRQVYSVLGAGTDGGDDDGSVSSARTGWARRAAEVIKRYVQGVAEVRGGWRFRRHRDAHCRWRPAGWRWTETKWSYPTLFNKANRVFLYAASTV